MKPIFLRDLKPWDWSKVRIPNKYQLKKIILLVAIAILVHDLLTDRLSNYGDNQFGIVISLVTGYTIANLIPENLVEHSYWLTIPYVLLQVNKY